MPIEADNVVLFHYCLRDAQGQEIESSDRDGEPAAYLHGHKAIIPGLEAAMAGRASGDRFTVTVKAADAYGERHDGPTQRIPLKHVHLKGKQKPRAGSVVWVETDQGPRQVTVVKAGQFMVEVDTNHPLAGQDITFDIEIIDVRDATQEELDHGHVHGTGGHKH
ncbi:MAG: peptidylprolyl isomerase [Gammaproteobacteria bacterium]|nr:MAG: peptidylprolyl isomerase [Gammaproteobacteria bacterium]